MKRAPASVKRFLIALFQKPDLQQELQSLYWETCMQWE